MKKKILIGLGIFLGLIVVAIIALSLIVKSYLKSEKLKALVIPKIEKTIGRDVAIDEINVSLFKGIVVKGFAVKEQDKTGNFVAAKEFILDYSLLSLLKRELVINKIELISPSLSVKRMQNGEYSFNDILQRIKEKKGEEKKEEKEKKELPITLITDKISIKDLQLQFTDALKELPSVAAKADMKFSITLGKEFKPMLQSGTIDLKALNVALNKFETRTTGTIEIKNEVITFTLLTAMDKENVSTSGSVKDYMEAPKVVLNISSKELNLEKLMALGSGAASSVQPGKKAAAPSAKPEKKAAAPQKSDKEKDALLSRVVANGEIKVDAARYKEYNFRNFLMRYAYRKGTVVLDPVAMEFAGGTTVSAAGTIKGDFKFNYELGQPNPAPTIKRTLTGKMVAALTKGQVKEMPIMNTLAFFTGVSELRNLSFDETKLNAVIKDQKIALDGYIRSALVRMNPTGTITFEKQLDIVTDLLLAPQVSPKISAAKSVAQFLKNEEGWTVIPLQIKGTVEKPAVGLNQAAVRKGLQKGLIQEFQKRLLPGQTDQRKQEGAAPGKKKPEDLLKGLFGK